MLRGAASRLHKPVAVGRRALQIGEQLAVCRQFAAAAAWQRSLAQNREHVAIRATQHLRRRAAFQSSLSSDLAKPNSVINGTHAPAQKLAEKQRNFVETEPAHGVAVNEMPAVRAIEDAPPEVLTFGDMSPTAIRMICKGNVPGWNLVPDDDICIDQLCEGLSNQNFKVYLNSEAKNSLTSCVLFRIYGKDAATLYDGGRELQIVKLLSSYQIGPTIYGNGEGWRIEEWHFSVPLPNRRMRNPAIFTQVASQLGRLHKLSGRRDFPADIVCSPVLSSERLGTWSEGCQKAAAQFKHPASHEAMRALNLDQVLGEKDWLADFVVADDPKIKGAGLDKVFSHWDSQENNILQTHYGLRFIDFEYSGMEHQAFDIATYFAECTIDYLVDEYPFFKVSMSDMPTEAEQRLFCSIYLSEYLETIVRPDDLAVSVLYERVQRFGLLVNYLWTLWSIIRAPQAPTFNDFDYLKFGQHRYFMYKWGKRALMHSSGARY